MPTFFKGSKRPATQVEPIHAEVPEIRGAELNAVYYGQRVGGDFYDFLRVGPNRVLLGLLDVAGKHECARTIAIDAQRTFRSEGPRLFAQNEFNEAEAMIELCLLLNRSILGVDGGAVRTCPAFAGCYNEDIGTICYFNAGHTPGLLRDRDGITELPATGLPLGLFSHVTCDAPTVAIEPGGALVVVSRGMIEGARKGEEYGIDRAKDLVQRDTTANARELCAALIDDVKSFMGTPPTHNDVTAVALIRES